MIDRDLRTRLARMSALVAALAMAVPPSSATAEAATAGQTVDERVDVGQPARALRVRVRVERDDVVLRAGGRREVLPLTSLATATVESVEVSGVGRIAIVRAGDGTRRIAALVVRGRGGQPTVPWIERVDLHGDPGERRAAGIELRDRTGDGVADVVVGRYEEATRLCGQDRTLLDPRALDPKSMTLRPVRLDRLGAAPAGTPTVDATATTPGPSKPPLLRDLRAAAASSRAGAVDPTAALPPIEITDGNPQSFWTEAYGARGRGEFVTLRRDTARFPIRAFALVLQPAENAALDRMARPQTLWLLGDEGARVQVRVPEDAKPGERVWIAPPSPLAWKCISIAFDTHHARGAKSGTGYGTLAEVEAYTDLDFGGGLPTLVDAMNDEGQAADDAALLATSVGAPVLPPLASAWGGFGQAGQKRAIRVFGALAAREAAARGALVTGLGADSAAVRDAALQALVDAGAEGLAALVPRVAKADATGDAAAIAIAKHAPDIALTPLLDAVGAKGGSERPVLREALALVGVARSESTTTAVETWSNTAGVSVAARAAVALALARVPPLAEMVQAIILRTRAEATEFVDLWRLVGAATTLPAQTDVDGWLAERAKSDERWMLRAAALDALRTRRASPARDAARAALGDTYPRVRSTALAMLADDEASFDRIAKHARQDTWTMVRVAALEAIALQPSAKAVLREAVGKRHRLVRAAAIRGLTRSKDTGAWELVKTRLEDDNEWPEVTTEAIAHAKALCIHDAADVLVEIVQRGAKPNAWEPDVRTGLEALDALTALGGEAAKRGRAAATTPVAPEAFQTSAKRSEGEKPTCPAP